MRAIDMIIVHCSATRPEWMADKSVNEKRDEIRRWHVEDNGWSDIGYHAVIDRDGSIAEGRDFATQGAHARGHNKTSLGPCLIGGHGSSENDAFSDNFTPAQNRALRRWIDDRKAEFPAITKVIGHNELSAKACPGFRVDRWLANKPPARTSAAESTTVQASTITAVAGAGGTVLASLSDMHPVVQGVFIGGCLLIVAMAAYIFRERIRKFAGGDR